MTKISREQYKKLEEACHYRSIESFNELLKEYTDIEACPYKAYEYYDSSNNYVGNSEDLCLDNILMDAYIEVEG